VTTIIRVPETPGLPYRLGRHVRHDPRSLAYAVAGVPTSALVSKRWERRVPVFDQQNLGSCVGNAAAGWLAADNTVRDGLTSWQGRSVDESLAVELYSAATRSDDYDGGYPPDDTGSDGLSGAKALRAAGMCIGYQHGFSLQAMLTALQAGPVMVGTVWLAGMVDPDAGRLFARGTVQGGHEYLVDEIDVVRRTVWLTNSWGARWGLGGRAYLSWDDMGLLLGQQGDVTVPTPVSAIPIPTPEPTPTSADETLAGALGELLPAAEAWLTTYSQTG
jgi:hypothetical protein